METFKHRELTIRIERDTEMQECPLDFDNTTRFVTFERNTFLSNYNKFDSPDAAVTWAEDNNFETVPLYKYEHGPVIYNTEPFACRWDSAQVGYVLVDLSGYEPHQVAAAAKGLCEAVTTWCNGDYYGYIIDLPDGTSESCWGFDDLDYCKATAIEEVDSLADAAQNALCEEMSTAD